MPITLTAYLSYWEGSISLSPHPTDEVAFRELGNLEVMVEGRKIMFVPTTNGNMGTSINRSRNGGLGVQYDFKAEPEGWARFQRHEVELEVESYDWLTCELPLNHKLPWPRFHTLPYLDEVVKREFEKRANSAVKYGGETELRVLLRGIPAKVRKYITAEVWLATIKGALANAT